MEQGQLFETKKPLLYYFSYAIKVDKQIRTAVILNETKGTYVIDLYGNSYPKTINKTTMRKGDDVWGYSFFLTYEEAVEGLKAKIKREITCLESSIACKKAQIQEYNAMLEEIEHENS